MTQLKITQGTGFHLKFKNGVTLSVQIGGGSYSANYDHDIGRPTYEKLLPPSRRAEIAVWCASDNEMIKFSGGDTVAAYISIDDILKLITLLHDLPGTPDKPLVAEVLKEHIHD